MKTKRSEATRAAGPRSRPGTAVKPKGQHRAEEILQAARAVLVAEGYSSLTTRKVAQRVGIRQSNVQYYFPAKVDLVRALFESAVAEHAQAIGRRMAQGRMSPRQQMLWSIDQFLSSHQSLEEKTFLRELWALAAHDPEVAEVMNDFYKKWVDLTAQSLLKVNPRLGLRRAQRRALLVIALVDGLSLFEGAGGLDHPATRGIENEVRSLVLALTEGDDKARE